MSTCRGLYVLLTIGTLVALSAAETVDASRYQLVPVISNVSSLNPTVASTFTYTYNPSIILMPGSNPCIAARVQMPLNGVSGAPGPSKIVATCNQNSSNVVNSFFSITSDSVIFEPSTPEEVLGTEDPRIARVDSADGNSHVYYMFYTAVAKQQSTGNWIARLSLASAHRPLDKTNWTRHGALFPDQDGFQFTKSGALLVPPRGAAYPPYLIFGDCSLYNGLQVAVASEDYKKYKVLEDLLLIEKRPGMFDAGLVEAGPPPIQIPYDNNFLFIYNGAQPFAGVPNNLFYAPGFVILNGSNPLQVLQRSQVPLIMPELAWETQGLTPYVIFVEGLVLSSWSTGSAEFVAYYGAADTSIGVVDVTVTWDAQLPAWRRQYSVKASRRSA